MNDIEALLSSVAHQHDITEDYDTKLARLRYEAKDRLYYPNEMYFKVKILDDGDFVVRFVPKDIYTLVRKLEHEIEFRLYQSKLLKLECWGGNAYTTEEYETYTVNHAREDLKKLGYTELE